VELTEVNGDVHTMCQFCIYACTHVRNTPHAEIELTENNDDVHTEASPQHSAPHFV